MINLNFPLYLCNIVLSFLFDRCFQVHVNNGISNPVFYKAGVPQGSVLGPILYILYTSDFPKIPQCETAIYADDTAIFSSHEFALVIETNLQNAMEIVIKPLIK